MPFKRKQNTPQASKRGVFHGKHVAARPLLRFTRMSVRKRGGTRETEVCPFYVMRSHKWLGSFVKNRWWTRVAEIQPCDWAVWAGKSMGDDCLLPHRLAGPFARLYVRSGSLRLTHGAQENIWHAQFFQRPVGQVRRIRCFVHQRHFIND